MSSYEDQIREIEEEIRRTKINKATEGHVGRLKAKIARLKREQQEKLLGGSGGGGDGYDVKKSGDSSVALIGLPSVGKSTILNRLSDQEISEVGGYHFTTLDAIPGTMKYRGASIQVIDLPGIISGASKGRGMGKKVLSVARGADLLLIVLDVFNSKEHFEIILNELFHVGIRVNQEAPDIVIRKTDRGGIAIASLKKLTNITEKTIKSIMTEYRLINAAVTIRSDINTDQLIDKLEGNRVYIPAFICINKIDLISKTEQEKLIRSFDNAIGISAEGNVNIDQLRDKIMDELDLIKIYLKPQGKDPDFDEPLIIRKGASVEEVCDKLHKTFKKDFRYARVWGNSAKHPGQKVSLRHYLEDGDLLTIIRNAR
jgi:small GTP-binding protein